MRGTEPLARPLLTRHGSYATLHSEALLSEGDSGWLTIAKGACGVPVFSGGARLATYSDCTQSTRSKSRNMVLVNVVEPMVRRSLRGGGGQTAITCINKAVTVGIRMATAVTAQAWPLKLTDVQT